MPRHSLERAFHPEVQAPRDKGYSQLRAIAVMVFKNLVYRTEILHSIPGTAGGIMNIVFLHKVIVCIYVLQQFFFTITGHAGKFVNITVLDHLALQTLDQWRSLIYKPGQQSGQVHIHGFIVFSDRKTPDHLGIVKHFNDYGIFRKVLFYHQRTDETPERTAYKLFCKSLDMLPVYRNLP